MKSVDKMQFLAGGGEMGRLIREKNWSETSLGPPQNWPQSLRTTLSIILNSKFPMFLFWGKDLICFYNDAYRPSLGIDGKHPSILGMKGEMAWAEIWPIIEPLIKQVIEEGTPTWSENQLIPIFRNNKIEDVYWTFSYSPVNDETNTPSGVFVTCFETTETVLTNAKLKESKEELEFAINATDLGTWDYDPITNKFTANERVRKWFGISGDEKTELEIAINVISENDRSRVMQAIQKAIEYDSGGYYDIEYSIIQRQTKKEIIVHAKGRAWFNKDRVAYRFNGTLEDITEKATASRKLKQSEQWYNQLIYSSPSAIGILFGRDLKITIANDEIIKIWGKSKSIIGHSYFEALPELAEQGYKEVFMKVYDTGVPFNAVETPVYILQEGRMTLRYYNFILYPLKGFNDEIEGIGIIATEVTSQAILNKRVRESEQRFAAAVDAMKGIIWTNNAIGEMKGEQAGWSKITGQKFNEYQGYGWTNAIHPDDVQSTLDSWNTSVRSGTIFNFEHRVKLKEGNYRVFSVKAIPVKNEDGSVSEWVGVHTDIHEQKLFFAELERQVQERTKQLAESNLELQKTNQELQSFAYISSHDLQEPLRKIQTFATRILDKDYNNISDKGKDHFKRMQQAAFRMQTLINDLLSYSKIGSKSKDFKTIHLNKIIKEVKDELLEDLKSKNATLETNELCEASIIPFQFRQVLYNLIGNSIKFSNPDKPLLIKIESKLSLGSEIILEKLLPHKKYCHITIKDNGIGFEQKYNELIFQVFQRLNNRSDYEGTGVGLAIVKKIIDNHHGLITASGEINIGAKFDIYLPVT